MLVGSSKLFGSKSSAVISFGGISLGLGFGDVEVTEVFGELVVPEFAPGEASLRHAAAHNPSSSPAATDKACRRRISTTPDSGACRLPETQVKGGDDEQVEQC